ncbi:hypothetical protein RVR_6129 [Actinacidiphila reveromycinica]|uniref:Uncharacterized protein n=1 Tax=Actinacidiphila reveromycinica TaxID=659352 RepID=A0A7U3UV84_9ACTN|nr:hypothetical protein [Streptomyces sp. SN-593]BBA99487.1 hypothetical protein RVR_6129 [Streptomyces sp. SN-593]
MTIGTTDAELRVADRARAWKITTTNGISTSGYLPDWAEEDPSATGLDPRELHVTLADIGHRSPFHGVALNAFTRDGGTEQAHEIDAFQGEIVCHPFPDADVPDGALLPTVNVQLTPDCWLIGLGPQQLGALAAKLRAHADLLDGDVRPRLVAAREDWSVHHDVGSRRL